jgi:hypothetical protein
MEQADDIDEAMYDRYRSAINYAGGKGILAVELIDF